MGIAKIVYVAMLVIMAFAALASALIVQSQLSGPGLYDCDIMLSIADRYCSQGDYSMCVSDSLFLPACNDVYINKMLDWEFDLTLSLLVFFMWVGVFVGCITYFKKKNSSNLWTPVPLFLGIIVALYFIGFEAIPDIEIKERPTIMEIDSEDYELVRTLLYQLEYRIGGAVATGGS